MTPVIPRTTRPGVRARFALLAAVGVIAALPVVAVPQTAAAAGGVTPILDCYRDNGDGTSWVVLGYANTTGAQQNLGFGSANRIHPSRLQRDQPRTFAIGTVHAAWRVLLSSDEIHRQDARWELDGTTLHFADRLRDASVCPPGTQLPADGNGVGTAVALTAAGAVGAVLVVRLRRRLDRQSQQPTSS